MIWFAAGIFVGLVCAIPAVISAYDRGKAAMANHVLTRYESYVPKFD